MKKITGELLNRCEKLEKEVKAILQTEMREHFTPRKITYEYCNATGYAGECRTRRKSDIEETAVIRLSRKFDISDDTIVHELIHACLPMNTFHGPLFQQAMDTLNEWGLQVSRFASADERKAINYKYVYRVSAPGRRPVIVKRQRITYTIKYLQAHGGQAVVNGQTFELM